MLRMQPRRIVKWTPAWKSIGAWFWGLFLMAVGAGTASLSPYLLFGAAAVFFALWLIPRLVSRKYGTAETDRTDVPQDVPRSPAVSVALESTDADPSGTEILSGHRNEIKWVANRSFSRWMEALSSIANPTEYDINY